MYFLNVALGSCAELLARVIGLNEVEIIDKTTFEEFDKRHYEVENKLLALIKSLQTKQQDGSWDQKIHEPETEYGITPLFQNSDNPDKQI